MPIGVNSPVEPRQQRRNHESGTKTRWRSVWTADHSSFTPRRSMPGLRRIRSIVAAQAAWSFGDLDTVHHKVCDELVDHGIPYDDADQACPGQIALAELRTVHIFVDIPRHAPHARSW